MFTAPITVEGMSTLSSQFHQSSTKRRGTNIYAATEIVGVGGYDKHGQYIDAQVQKPLFYLTIEERLEITRLCAYVFGIVTSRMNKISCLEYTVTRKKNEEDKIVEHLKMYRDIWKEHAGESRQSRIIQRKMWMVIREELKDIKVDLSNFDGSLRRWSKLNSNRTEASQQEIIDWIENCNREDDFGEYRKKWVFDLLVHGAAAHYKEYVDGVLENFYLLPGGSVLPLRSRYVGGGSGYVQLIEIDTPKIYFHDELTFNSWMPNSALSYGLVPLEALVNKVCETLLFDQRAADQADGTKPPEKAIVFGKQSGLFGDINSMDKFLVPADESEQERVETVVNEARKNAIRVLTGIGTPQILDLSRENIFQFQSERQQQLLKDIALVFNTSNMEINLTGGDETSGRSTSESQAKIEREKGIYPITNIIDKTMTHQFLPFKFGEGWLFEEKTGLSENEKIAMSTAKKQSGTYTIDEIREARGDDPLTDEQKKELAGQQQGQPPAGQPGQQAGGMDMASLLGG